LATALPFHRAIVEDPAFTENFAVYTSYIESEFVNEIPAFGKGAAHVPSHAAAEHFVAEVNGHRFDVILHAPEPIHKRHRAKKGMSGLITGDGLTSPMQGTVVKIAAGEGDFVEVGDLVIVLEAMKMEQPLMAHKSGIVTNLVAIIGENVSNGARLCDIIDA
jgi:acetyl-CoA/propionyl-CoA carboxylase biotin carboxyl carrier protein